MTNSGGRDHWRAKAAEANKWKTLVYSAVASQIPQTPLRMARMVIYRYSSQAPDCDGLVSGFKHVIDGLVSAGILEDDKWVNTFGMPDYRWRKAPVKKGKIRVEVYPVFLCYSVDH